MKTIDWSLAPEGCLGAVRSKSGNKDFEYGIFVTKTKDCMEDGYHYCGHTNAGPAMALHDFIPKPEFNNYKESNMNKFDLELGDKVIVNDVGEVTIVGFTAKNLPVFEDVSGCVDVICDNSVYTLAPKKLSGFVNIYRDSGISDHVSRISADHYPKDNRVACIDLSQFEEGHEL